MPNAGLDKPILEEGPVAPFHATVKVIPVHMTRARRSATPRDVDFHVCLEWTGPPAFGMHPDPNPGLRQDVYTTGDVELARALARSALQQLGRGEVPDLRDIAEALRARIAAGPYG